MPRHSVCARVRACMCVRVCVLRWFATVCIQYCVQPVRYYVQHVRYCVQEVQPVRYYEQHLRYRPHGTMYKILREFDP